MLKKLTVACVLSVTALASAFPILVVGSFGKGAATSDAGKIARFDYSVLKRTADGRQPQYEGRLRFEQKGDSSSAPVLIEMGRPHGVNVQERTCEFAGQGTLTTIHEGQRVQLHGRVSGVVTDARNPEHHDGIDVISIKFEDAQGRTFQFKGQVNHGDLVVFVRQGR